jgi:hypothetical protein
MVAPSTEYNEEKEEKEENDAVKCEMPAPQLASFPLSHGQRALWFLQQLDPASVAYNVARALRIRSPINLDAVRQTIQWAVDRQPALRTTFADTPNGPVQQVQPHLPALFQVEQATDWTPDQLNQRITEETYLLFIENTDRPVEINGVLLEPVPGQVRTSLFDLMLHVVDFTNGLGAVLEYNVALFDEDTAARFLRHF